MKERLTALLPYAAVLAADLYLLPFLIRDTGSAMVLMLSVMPFTAFFCAVAYGVRHGFGPWLAVIAVLLFLPTVPLYYNSTAWVYGPAYGLIVLMGNGLGRLFYRRRR